MFRFVCCSVLAKEVGQALSELCIRLADPCVGKISRVLLAHEQAEAIGGGGIH